MNSLGLSLAANVTQDTTGIAPYVPVITTIAVAVVVFIIIIILVKVKWWGEA